jgi:hypothetical protein
MSQQQHVEFHRKVQMRRHLLRRWELPNPAAYVPFIGDGDLALELYPSLLVYGADLSDDRVATARERMPAAKLVTADCNVFPFAHWHTLPQFALGDFDAYSEPYTAFRSFWARAPLADRLMLFFTDGQRQTMMRGKFGTAGYWVEPSGAIREEEDHTLRSATFNSYFSKSIWPWFEEFVAPWRIVDRFRYLRGWMLYWGAVIERG